MFVLAISGSLRRDSHNKRLLGATRRLLPAGAELELFSRLAEIPPYSEDEEHVVPPAVAALRAAIAAADAILIATPEYNGSIPGQLKKALGWISRPPAGMAPPGQAGGGDRARPRAVRGGRERGAVGKKGEV